MASWTWSMPTMRIALLRATGSARSSDPAVDPRLVDPIGFPELRLQVSLLSSYHSPSKHAHYWDQQQQRPERVHEQREAHVQPRQGDIERIPGESERPVGNQRERRLVRTDIGSGALHGRLSRASQEAAGHEESEADPTSGKR